MKKLLTLLLAFALLCTVKAQFTGTDSLRNFNNRFIDNNASKAFTNLRLHNLISGIIDFLDSARGGGGALLGVDTIWITQDSILHYRKNGVFIQHIVRGNPGAGTLGQIPFSNGLARFNNDSNFIYDLSQGLNNGRLVVGPTVINDGGLSKINSTSDNMNALALTSFGTGANTIIMRRALGSVGLPLAITSGTDLWNFSGRGYTGSVFTTSRANIYARATQNWTDTTQGTSLYFGTTPNDSSNMHLTMQINHDGRVYMPAYGSLPPETDTAQFKPVGMNASGQVGVMSAWTGGGSLTPNPVGSSPNSNAVTIIGNQFTLQPAAIGFPGVITKDTQSIDGSKHFTGKTTTFQGYSPQLNTQYLPTQIVADSFHNGKYLGFGGIDVFPSGKFVMVYSQSDNHIGDNGFIRMSKSSDQGRHWDTAIIAKSSDSALALGAMGVSQTGRLLVFYQKVEPGTTGFGNMFIKYSDDEGVTWSDSTVIPHGSNAAYNPYGGLVKIANDKLLFSWYGYTIGGAYNSYVITSSDNGKTWSSAVLVYSSSIVKPTETMFTHLGGGVIIGLARSDSTFKYTQLISKDNGGTWDTLGRVAFGFQATPAWVKTYENEFGNRVVVAYYRYSPTVGVKEIHAIYGYADSLIMNGVNGWDLTTEKKIADSVDGSGYITVVHPRDKPGAYGYYYDETSPQAISSIKFVRLPNNFASPIGSRGVFGLTAGRVAISQNLNSVHDFDALQYNDRDTVLHFGGGSGRDWDDLLGGAIEGGNSSIMLNTGAIGILGNLYLGRNGGGPSASDYRYASNGSASVIFNTGGSIFGYTAGAGSINQPAALSERFRFTNTGEFWLNNSAGTDQYSIVSAGVGSAASYKPRFYTLADFPADANNTGTSETDLYSYSMPGATLHANLQKVNFDVNGDFNDATATPRIRLYFAGNLIYDSGVLTLTGTGSWSGIVKIMRTNSGIVRTSVSFTASNAGLTNTVENHEYSSIDFTVSNILKITGTATGGGGGSNDITGRFGTVYFVPQQ